MYGTLGMLGGELARQRMEDRMREARLERLAAGARAARPAHRRAAARRMADATLGLLAWPMRH
jgi:hypothetical protein